MSQRKKKQVAKPKDLEATQKLAAVEPEPTKPAPTVAGARSSLWGDEPLAVALLAVVILFLLVMVLITAVSI